MELKMKPSLGTQTASKFECSVPHHGEMQPSESHTPETKWCGEWWECRMPDCFNAVLVPSHGLWSSFEYGQEALDVA